MEKFKRKLIFGIIYIGIGIALTLIGYYFLWINKPYYSWDPLLAIGLWLISGILFIAGVGLLVRSASIKRMKHQVKKIGEDNKKIVDYLKTENSGVTQFKLGSVLHIDGKTMKKCLKHLEWLGLVEKKKVSAEETLFFYKEGQEENNSTK
ncbi:MAG: hypothetical protein ACFE8V_05215 [Promethearchaeota archaeon]